MDRLARLHASPRPYDASPQLGSATRSVRFDERTIGHARRRAARTPRLSSTVPESQRRSRAAVPSSPNRRGGTRTQVFRISLVLTSMFVLCVGAGCGIIMIGEPVQELEIESQDDAQENLKAIRKMLADEVKRSRDTVGKPSDHSSVPPLQPVSNPVSEMSATPDSLPSPSSRPKGHATATAKLPWSPPPLERPHPPDRPVPAYTIPAPVGPDHSGSIRCAPDGLGGQRCVGR